MIKTAALIMLMLITSAAGNTLAQSLKIRAEGLRLTARMINEIESLIEYKSATVYEIISCLKGDSRFESFGFIENTAELCRNGLPFAEAWEKAVRKNPPRYFAASDTELLCSVGCELGTSGTEGQLSSLRFKKREAERLSEEASVRYASQGKLYRSLGVLAGAFLAVFLI